MMIRGRLAQKAGKHYTLAMSYVQEVQMPTVHGQAVGRPPLVVPTRAALSLLLTLAFLHGCLYALFLPPWGLIDEAQHLHYIQTIAEQQSLPVAGNLYLSDEIVASLFATRRWETFHWTPPPSALPQEMGLEGYSYEAYQPPLFYLAMTPVYWLLPQDMLSKVYGLRVAAVLLSLVTVWATYRAAGLLLPQFPRLPFWAGLLLVSIPERAIATSRINNDVLLEVVGALFFLVLTHAVVAGLNGRRGLLLGLLLGLGVWVKISAGVLGVPLLLFLWLHRRDPAWWKGMTWVTVVAAPLGLALVLRNLWFYGDLTGFAAFEQLHRLAPVDTSFMGFVRALVSLTNHFWLVWWKGSEVGQNSLLTLFYVLMAFVVAAAWWRLGSELWPRRKVEMLVPMQRQQRGLALIYGVAIVAYAVAVFNGYYQGMVPVIQGRFMLPVVLPFVLLLVWGISYFARGEQITLVVVVGLWGMGLLSLFGNLVPYYYYWSGVLAGTMPPLAGLGAMEMARLIFERVMMDKPPMLAPLLLALPVFYLLMLLWVLIVTLWVMRRSRSCQPNVVRIPVHP